MKLLNLLTRIFCTSLLVTVSSYALAGWFSGAEVRKILDQNPQVKRAGILPTNLDTRSGDQCRQFSEGRHDHHSEALSASLKGITRSHTCMYIDSDKGFKSYEKGYGEKRHFVLALHLDTPKVWRVYELKPSARAGKSYEVSLLAEFDIHGKRVAATATESSRQAEPYSPSQNYKSQSQRLDEQCAVVSNTKSSQTIAECRIYRPGSPGSERNHEAGSPGGDDVSAAPPPADTALESAVKKGMGDLLKGFGR